MCGALAMPAAPSLAFVFQEPTLMPWATVMRNVTLPLELAGVKRSEAGWQALARFGKKLRGFEAGKVRAVATSARSSLRLKLPRPPIRH